MGQGIFTWGYLMQFALERVRAGQFARRWDYVLVDEAQDLPPVALALCVELCRKPSGVFLTADANQSLYNRGFRWGNVHDQLQVKGRSRILRRNYRSTRQIMENDPCIKVTTLHAAKGLEFPMVVVAHVEAGLLPRDTRATDPEELETFLQEQRRLFYVGCTRAMRYLFITYDQQVPSPFLQGLTDEHWERL